MLMVKNKIKAYKPIEIIAYKPIELFKLKYIGKIEGTAQTLKNNSYRVNIIRNFQYLTDNA